MAQEKIIWTALPHGMQGGSLRLSVFASPRLSGAATLGSYSYFQAWPDALKTTKFVVAFGNGTNLTEVSGKVKRVSKTSSEAWATLFPASTPVESHTFDNYSSRLIRSFPVAEVLNTLRTTYQTVGALSGAVPPEIKFLLTKNGTYDALTFGQLLPRANIQQYQEGLRTEIARALRSGFSPGKLITDPVQHVQANFLQTSIFHEAPRHSPGGRPGPIRKNDAMDFHRRISSLLEYPDLLRLLGLVVELEIPWTSPTPTDTWVSAAPSWPAGGPTGAIAARTQLSSHPTFYPASRAEGPSDITDGRVRLRNLDFQVVTVDVDGAALKTLDLAANLARAVQHGSTDTPTRMTLPSLRSAGLAVTRAERATQAAQNFDASSKNNQAAQSGGQVMLYAEDVVRGYRVDVREVKASGFGPWRSLCARQETHQIGALPSVVVQTEGVVSTAMTQKPDDPSSDLYLHESLFRWSGWSLSVPPRPSATGTGGKFPLATTLKAVPQSLVPLRFGHTYQFHMRTADIAGNGPASPGAPAVTARMDEIVPDGGKLALTSSIADAYLSSPEQGFYARFEPISAPTVVPVVDVTTFPGESVERLVVRSNKGQTPTQYAATGPISKLHIPPQSERHFAPPAVSRDMAEAHGMLDQGGLPQPALIAKAVAGEKVRLPDAAKKISVEYLPDPLAQGVCLVGLPKPDAPLALFDFWPAGSGAALKVTVPKTDAVAENWPSGAKPFRLQLEGIPAGEPNHCKVDNAARVVTVYLAQAEALILQASCYPDPRLSQELDILGVYRWITEGISAAEAGDPAAKAKALDIVKQFGRGGLLWPLMPSRPLVLVHAVQQPLEAPEFDPAVVLGKGAGQTYASFLGTATVSGISTDKVAVLGYWREYHDLPDQPAPVYPSAHGQAFEMDVAMQETQITLGTLRGVKQHHDFGDTRHRHVVYSPVATTRFRDYFPQPPADTAPLVLKAAGSGASEGAVAQKSVHHNSSEASFPIGDLKPEIVPPTATAGLLLTRTGKPLALEVLSSARPDAPNVLYVLPSFAWDESKGKSIRRSGLRIYLERPWFSSGGDELLGIIVPNESIKNQPSGLIAEPYKSFVTQWGLDPLWGTAGTVDSASPLLKDFRNLPAPHRQNTPVAELALDELSAIGSSSIADAFGMSLGVVPYPVNYDPYRKLWFTDIEFDTGSTYFPFIRLAVARYQPYSVTGLALSRVVLTDFMQIAPDRTASVTPAPGSLPSYTVAVSGVSITQSRFSGDAQDGPTLMQVSLEYSAKHAETVSEVESLLIHGTRHAASDDLAWTPITESVQYLTAENSGAPGTVHWAGTVSSPYPRAGRPHRVMVKEYERYAVDAPVAPPDGGEDSLVGYRLVYAAALPV